jgi:hypothetical protein
MKKIDMWRAIPFNKRKLLKTKFKIKASGSIEVMNNTIVRDGIAEADLKNIKEEELAQILGIKIKEEKINDEKNKEKNIK